MTNVPEPGSRGRSLRCTLGIHRYVDATNDKYHAYLVCRRCGKEEWPYAEEPIIWLRDVDPSTDRDAPMTPPREKGEAG